jgi:hypothetical protein
MTKNMRIRVALFAVVTALVVGASSAVAVGGVPNGAQPHPSVLATGGPYDCAANANPDPVYSSSNRTVHWGIRIDYCLPTQTIQIKGALQELEGSTWTTQDRYPSAGYYTTVGSGWGTTRFLNCVDNVPHEWRIQVYIIIDGVPGTPNPGYSDEYRLPCE